MNGAASRSEGLTRWAHLALAIVAFGLYTNVPVVAVRFHGVPFAVAAALPLLLLLPIGYELVFRGRQPLVTPALPWILGFLVVQLLGALLALHPETSMAALWSFVLEGLLIYLLVTNAIRTPEALQRVVWSLLAAGACMGALVAYQQLTKSFDSDFAGFAQVDMGPGFATGEMGREGAMRQRRLTGPLGVPNRFAQIMAVLVPLAFFQVRAALGRRAKLLALGALVLTVIGCAVGFSRGAIVGLGLTFLLMLAMGHFRAKHLVVAGLAVLGVALVVPQYAVRIASIGRVADLVTQAGGPGVANADGATRGRVTEMIAAVLIFADHPILGVGPSMYPQHYIDYARVAGGKVRPGTRQAHSLFLEVAAEHGIAGLVTFFGAVFVTLLSLERARRRWQHARPDLANLVTGLAFALVAYLATGLFLHASYIRYLWFLMAVTGAAGCLVDAEERSPLGRFTLLVRRGAPPAPTPDGHGAGARC